MISWFLKTCFRVQLCHYAMGQMFSPDAATESDELAAHPPPAAAPAGAAEDPPAPRDVTLGSLDDEDKI
jgi:hypothetical protein